jgi:hypothetical protein
MKVRMIADVSGTRDGVDWPKRGELLEVPAAEGADLVAANLAVEHVEEPPVESAAASTTPKTTRGKA